MMNLRDSVYSDIQNPEKRFRYFVVTRTPISGCDTSQKETVNQKTEDYQCHDILLHEGKLSSVSPLFIYPRTALARGMRDKTVIK